MADIFGGLRGLVRGWVWRVRMSNGAVFDWWTARGNVSRKDARRELMAVANRITEPDSPAYYPDDVERVWRTTGTGRRRDES